MWTLDEISLLHGVSKQVLYTRCYNYKIKPTRDGNKRMYTDDQKDRIILLLQPKTKRYDAKKIKFIEMYRHSMSPSLIASELKSSLVLVKMAIAEFQKDGCIIVESKINSLH